jgi:hypothetical protein
MRQARFFSVSNADLYNHLERELPRRFSEKKFRFLGSTFADNAPWKPGQKSDLLPTSRLLWRWALMNERTVRVYKPALECGAYDAIFVHEFGREAYHYAIRHQDCDETLEFHKGLVQDRLVQQKINPPEYLATRPEDPRFIRADEAYFADPKQKLHYLSGRDSAEQCREVVRIFRTIFGNLYLDA